MTHLLAAIMIGSVVLGSSGLAHAQEVVLATWGGAWGKAFQEAAIEPFEKATGIKVRVIYGVSSTNLAQVAAQKENPQIDVITMVAGDGIAAWQRGLTAALDPREIPALNDLADVALRREKDAVIFAGMWTYPRRPPLTFST